MWNENDDAVAAGAEGYKYDDNIVQIKNIKKFKCEMKMMMLQVQRVTKQAIVEEVALLRSSPFHRYDHRNHCNHRNHRNHRIHRNRCNRHTHRNHRNHCNKKSSRSWRSSPSCQYPGLAAPSVSPSLGAVTTAAFPLAPGSRFHLIQVFFIGWSFYLFY